MVEPISLTVGAVILAAGWLAGRFTRTKRQRPVDYICTCTHSLAFHDPKTGRCRHIEYYNSEEDHEPCTCRQYLGERPIDVTTLGLPGVPEKGGDRD